MDGILIVNKPQGMTSHDVVDFIRRRFALKKVGHAGTLDPMATGVLIILIGNCTKSSNRFINDDKEYEAALIFGAASDTGDAWGKIVSSDGDLALTDEKIRETFSRFVGEIEQVPPSYSAVKVKGRKLYELARKGIKVDVEPRKIHIKEIVITKRIGQEVFFKVTCSKGTYIRQLAADIGNAIGCGAYLSQLRRTRSGNFTLDRALTIERLGAVEGAELETLLI